MILKNLVALRKKYHLTQEEMAEQIGVSRISVAKWESGESMPDMNNCIALASMHQVSLDEIEPGDKRLFFGDEEKGIGILPEKAVHGLLKIIGTPMFRQGGNEDE